MWVSGAATFVKVLVGNAAISLLVLVFDETSGQAFVHYELSVKASVAQFLVCAQEEDFFRRNCH